MKPSVCIVNNRTKNSNEKDSHLSCPSDCRDAVQPCLFWKWDQQEHVLSGKPIHGCAGLTDYIKRIGQFQFRIYKLSYTFLFSMTVNSIINHFEISSPSGSISLSTSDPTLTRFTIAHTNKLCSSSCYPFL